MPNDTYRHTQKGPWGLMLYGFSAVFFVVSSYIPVFALQITFAITGLVMALLAMSLGHLTVSDEGDHLSVFFGPLRIFRRRISYDEIIEVEVGRTTFFDGWGIHWVPGRGWVWNIWGFGCVQLQLKRRSFRIGTDDPDGLAAFLQSRISSANL